MKKPKTYHIHQSLPFQQTAIVSLEYAKRNYDCYCRDCRFQLKEAIELGVKFVIIYGEHIIGVVL